MKNITNHASRLDHLSNQTMANTKEISDFRSEMTRSTESLRSDLKHNVKKLRAGISSAIALTQVPQAIASGENVLGVGAGTFRNESALAIGYSRASDNGKLLFKVGGTASSRGDFGAGAGVGIRWR